MKHINIKTIVLILIALMVGLGLGYVLFSQSNTTKLNDKVVVKSETETTYTCSMHPQIRQNESGICPICEMDLTLLDASTSDNPLVLEMTETAVKMANIQTTIIGQKSTATKKITLSGKLQADERLVASQVTHLPGRIEKLYVSFTGESIRKGQKIAEIYAPRLIEAQRELIEALKYKTINSELLTAARKKLMYWKVSASQIEAIEETGEIQETFTLFADASGVISKRSVAVGDYLKEGEVLFDVVDLNNLWVLFDAYEEDLAHISLGNRVQFSTQAIPNHNFYTTISFINPVIDPKTRVASLRGVIQNQNGMLKPEMFVTGTLEGNMTKKQLTVPKSAVMWTGTRSVVYIKVPNTQIPSFEYRVVEIGDGLGDSYLIEKGLSIGDEVVTNGNFTIDAAAQLNNQASMMNQTIGIKGQNKTQETPDFRTITSIEFRQQLKTLTDDYLNLKDAFVQTDVENAQKMAANFVNQLAKINITLVKGDALFYWKKQLNIFKVHGTKIMALEDIEAQRQQFQYISNALIQSIQAFGTMNEILYIQNCPMAFDNTGGDWLSTKKVIQNPYFGDKMMKCGTIKDELIIEVE